MRRRISPLVVVALVSLTTLSAQQPVFRGRGDAVRVFVTATDRDGRIVPTLAKEDFEIRDDGKPQPIIIFDNTPQPIRLIVLLDVSGSMQGNLPLLRSASEQLFARLRPDDLARVGSFGRTVTISSEFTHDIRPLRDAIPQVIQPDAPTPSWRAVDGAMTALGDASVLRRVVLVVRDGKDTGSTGPTSFGKKIASQGEVIDRAGTDNVMIYAVGMRSRQQHTAPGAGMAGLQAAMLADLPDPGLA